MPKHKGSYLNQRCAVILGVNTNGTKAGILLSVLMLASLMLSFAAQATTPLTTALTAQLCGIVDNIRAVVGILALALFLIGGVLYAIAHFLPTSLDYRKSLVGWSTAMITGGIIGLIVVLLAPFIVQTINSLGGTGGGSSLTSISC